MPKCVFSGGSSTASTKSATIEMYVGSSTGYNDTMSGETMSSISEKSGSYISEEHHHHHVSVGGHGGGHHHRLHHQQLQQQPQHLMQTTEFDVWPFKASAEVKCFLTHYFSYRKKTYEYPHCLKLSNSRVELISWTTTRNYLSHQQTTQLCQGSLLAWPPPLVIATR